jgi:hypothetical protein
MPILQIVPPEPVVVGYFGQSTRQFVGQETAFHVAIRAGLRDPLGFDEWDAFPDNMSHSGVGFGGVVKSFPCSKTDFDAQLRGGDSGV